MKHGKWFFVYTYPTTKFYPPIRNMAAALEQKEIPLTNATEDEVIKEAKIIWEKEREEAIAHWEERITDLSFLPEDLQDSEDAQNSEYIQNLVPSDPHIIYKITL